ncbi:hydantoinase/oxoprolinase family protein [Archaeoglobales archaeon]|nr:MAG: hydantoinase/oxoprolinase family protein [Archaeoglobales archaeon]
MVIGIDVGGTNTDAAIVGDEIVTVKLPNEEGIGGILKKLSDYSDLKREKVIVSTSLPLNLILSKFNESKTLTLLIPGPGLNYASIGKIVQGFVNHRGDIVENIDEKEIRDAFKEKADNVAIASKFSVRNAEIEYRVLEIAKDYFDEKVIALSHHIGMLNFPLRANTTVVNAKLSKTVYELTDLIKSYTGDFFYYKGDGGIIPYQMALKNPSELYNSSSAAVAVGAYYLTKEKNALVLDIGGTTTDFVVLENGMPKIAEKIEIMGRKTLIRCVDSFSIPFGGDSVVEDGKLKPCREDRALAFGGSKFTLTDALNCIGYDIGDSKVSRRAGKETLGDVKNAESIVDSYIHMVSEAIKSVEAERIIGTGYLAKILTPIIAKKANVSFLIPEHSEAANAVGVAVSKISLTLYARFDTEIGRVTFNGIIESSPFKQGSLPEDDEFVDAAIKKVRDIALSYGAVEEEVKDVKVIYFNAYTVVRGGIKRGKIADVIVQIEPGISSVLV